MNVNLNKILKEELLTIRQNRLHESLSELNDIDDRDFFIVQYLSKSSSLLDEGYSIEEIESISENIFTDKLKQGAGAVSADIMGNTNILDALFGGGLGMIKEQIIRWVLTQLGVGKGAAVILAATLEQTDPRELLRIFKTKELCVSGMPKISDGVMAGIIRYLQFGDGGVQVNTPDMLKVGLGNIVDEVITQSNLGETIGNKLCQAIWK